MAVTLGTGYMQIVPSMQGVGTQIRQKMQAIAPSVGAAAGSGISKAMASSLNLQAAGAKLKSWGDSIAGVGSSLTRTITKPALIAGAAVGGIFAGLGFKRLVAIDTARAQFQGLGYDADKVMKQVAEGVNNTSLSMQEGASIAVAALATNNVSLEGLEAQIKRVSNVSAAYGVEASHAGYLLNNVLVKNKVTWGDLSQMQRNQIPIVSMLAETYGKTGDEITAMAQNGEISIEMLNRAIDEHAGAAAESFASSWAGMVKNVVANIGKIGAAFLEGAFPLAKQKLAEFLQMLRSDKAMDIAREWGQKFAVIMQNLADKASQVLAWWKQLSPSTKKLAGQLALAAVAAGPLIQIFGRGISIVGGITSGVGRLVGWVGKLAPGFVGASGGAGTLISKLGRFAGPIGAVVAGFTALWTQSEQFRDAIKNLASTIGSAMKSVWDAIQPVIKNIADKLMPIIAKIGDVLATVIEKLAPVFAKIGEFIATLIEKLSPIIDFIMDLLGPAFEWLLDVVIWVFEAMGPVIDFFVDILGGLVDFIVAIFSGDWEAAWEAIKGIFVRIWEGIKSVALAVWDWMVDIFTSMMDAIKQAWETGWELLRTIATVAWTGIKSAVSTGIGAVKTSVETTLGAIKATWSAGWTTIGTTVSTAWKNIKEGVSTGIKTVLTVLKGFPSQVLNVFKGFGTLLFNSGKALIDGLTAGIRVAFQGAKSAVSQGLAAIRALLPFSPAKEGPFSGRGWTLYSGEAIVEALAEGARSKAAVFREAIAETMTSGQSAIRDLALGNTFTTSEPFAATSWAQGPQVAYYDHRRVYNPVAEPDSIQVNKNLQLAASNVGGFA